MTCDWPWFIPTGNRHAHKPEGIESFRHVGNNNMPRSSRIEEFWIQSDPVFGPYEIGIYENDS